MSPHFNISNNQAHSGKVAREENVTLLEKELEPLVELQVTTVRPSRH